MIAQLNPAVRLTPPSDVTGERWIADDLVGRRRYRLSAEAAAVLVAACRPQEREQLVQRLAAIGGTRSEDGWASLVDDLQGRSLIIDASVAAEDPEISWLTRIRRSWGRFGWHEAAEYHVATFDYPCVDYAQAGAMRADRDRMRRYQSAEPDTDRFKLDYLDRPETPLPEPNDEFPTGTARAVWGDGVEATHADADGLKAILSLTFGTTGMAYPVTDAAPLLLRSSPSGGARHPSEGYVVVRDLAGVEAGWYHVTMRPFGLRRLDGMPIDDAALRPLFPEAMGRCPFDPRVLIVITSVFERNMYRYREPRTFRTVHMDAGHLAATACIAARSLGLCWAMFPCDDGRAIEDVLGIDGMREGYMVTVAVSDGAAGRAAS